MNKLIIPVIIKFLEPIKKNFWLYKVLLIKLTQVFHFVLKLILLVILFNLHPIISVSLQTKKYKGKTKLTVPCNNGLAA